MKTILLALFFGPIVAFATAVPLSHSAASLIFEEDGIVPGKKLSAGLFLEIKEDWHSYWKNPGDSGATPSFRWELPKGLSVSGPSYSTPRRYQVGHLEAFGYASEALYVFELKSEASLPLGKVPVSLTAEWLVCKETCVPQRHTFQIELPVVAKASAVPDAVIFARYAAKSPQAQPGMSFQIQEKGQHVEVKWEAPGNVTPTDFFAGPELGVKLQKPTFEKSGGAWVFRLEKESFKRLPAYLGELTFVEAGSDTTQAVPVEITQRATGGWLQSVLFAFLGGLLLNLMPCVFPVLSIKVFSVLEQSGRGNQWVRKSSLIYALGIFLSLVLLGGTLAGLRAWGEAVGWGFQLQSPAFLLTLIFLFTALGASFLGAIDLSWLQIGAGGKLAGKEGWVGDFFSGMLCVAVASPCTAPFMGAALGFAIVQPLPILLSIFGAMGLGLSFPYLLLALFPKAVKGLPRPGKWMETFKELMAFPLLGTVVWLFWVLGRSAGVTAVSVGLFGLLVCAFGFWFFSRFQKPILRTVGFLLIVGSFVGAIAATHGAKAATDVKSSGGVDWKPFSESEANALSREGRLVFVDFTASWCITCQVNEEVTFSSQAMRDYVKEKQIVMMKADWTREDPEITRVLQSYGRIGVPFYVVYDANSKGVGKPLGEILTPKIFKEAFP